MKNLSGLMDRRVLLEVAVKSTTGEPNPTYSELATVWAGKKDETLMQESADGKQIVATGRTTWTLRYRPDVLPTGRLTDTSTGIVYNIEGVSEYGRKDATILQTRRYNK